VNWDCFASLAITSRAFEIRKVVRVLRSCPTNEKRRGGKKISFSMTTSVFFGVGGDLVSKKGKRRARIVGYSWIGTTLFVQEEAHPVGGAVALGADIVDGGKRGREKRKGGG